MSLQSAVNDGSTLDDDGADRLQPIWETIRAGLRRDCGARTFDGWLPPDRARQFRLGDCDLAPGAALPVHGGLGADPFRRAAGPGLARGLSGGPPYPDRSRPGRARNRGGRRNSRTGPGRAAGGGERRPLCRCPGAALPLREFRRRQGERGRLQCRAARSRPRTRSPSTRSSSMAAPVSARPICSTPSATNITACTRARRSSTCRPRTLHGRVRRRVARQGDDPLQAAAALGRPADDRRRPVHRRQGIRPRKNSSTR